MTTITDDPLALPDDDVPYEGMPEFLVRPVREWLEDVLDGMYDGEAFARIVALRLRRSARGNQSYRTTLIYGPVDDLLRVTNAVLQLLNWDSHLGNPLDGMTVRAHVPQLELRLIYAGSAYTVDESNEQLVRRVDPTVKEAVTTAASGAPPTAADHLRAAWVAVYGIDPDPDKVYNEAVRALEEIACPLICPHADGKRTLGKAIADLRSDLKANTPKWELVLPDRNGNPASVTVLIEMMELLWGSQLSRHAGNTKSRRQDQNEAELAVHLAATLVLWLSNGVLRKRP